MKCQPVILRAYAFEREILPGMVQSVTDKNGNIIETPVSPKADYFIYLETGPVRSIDVKNIWINEVNYDAGLRIVNKTPVILGIHPGPGNADTLVKKTSNKVWEVQVKQKSDKKMPIALEQSKSKIVIACLNNGKVFYYTLDQIKKLRPLSAQ